jgi:hypothetical protein
MSIRTKCLKSCYSNIYGTSVVVIVKVVSLFVIKETEQMLSSPELRDVSVILSAVTLSSGRLMDSYSKPQEGSSFLCCFSRAFTRHSESLLRHWRLSYGAQSTKHIWAIIKLSWRFNHTTATAGTREGKNLSLHTSG